MTMPVTDEQVAAMRAYLKGDTELHHQIYGQLSRDEARTSYMALLTAAFIEAVDRRFAEAGTPLMVNVRQTGESPVASGLPGRSARCAGAPHANLSGVISRRG
jgi:hypothetical protein